VTSPRQPSYFSPVSPHQCFLLFSTPTFDLPLTRQSFRSSRKVLGEHHPHGKSRRSIALDLSRLMFCDPLFKILGMPSVIGIVGTAKNVDKIFHGTTMASSGRIEQEWKALRLGLRPRSGHSTRQTVARLAMSEPRNSEASRMEAAGGEPASERPVAAEPYMLSRP